MITDVAKARAMHEPSPVSILDNLLHSDLVAEGVVQREFGFDVVRVTRLR